MHPANYRDGLSNTPFYHVWATIVARCNNPRNNIYYRYGAIGIKCLWNSFPEFRDDMYASYLRHQEEYGARDTSIDRIDNFGSYSKENCRWATRIGQANNTSRNIFYSFRGQRMTIAQIARLVGISQSLLWSRVNKNGLTIEEAVSKPVRLRKKE